MTVIGLGAKKQTKMSEIQIETFDNPLRRGGGRNTLNLPIFIVNVSK